MKWLSRCLKPAGATVGGDCPDAHGSPVAPLVSMLMSSKLMAAACIAADRAAFMSDALSGLADVLQVSTVAAAR